MPLLVEVVFEVAVGVVFETLFEAVAEVVVDVVREAPVEVVVDVVREAPVEVVVDVVREAPVEFVVEVVVGRRLAETVNATFDTVVSLEQVDDGVSEVLLEEVPGGGKVIEVLVRVGKSSCLFPHRATTSLARFAWPNSESELVLTESHEAWIFSCTAMIPCRQSGEQVLPRAKSSMEQPRMGLLHATTHLNSSDDEGIDSKSASVKRNRPDTSTANRSTNNKELARCNSLVAIALSAAQA
ncbi:uncharacterized protein MAM_00199 [Metarhizium album ARSEF 1941]|uniref:Uncharacterized protein n=1 Tax=Metarhizium album (strain ARSEF 1941) TaxID=1081103 RepID=A0A0B2X609_METAS|nr:uncharacterized protein MAM_00199 [Metarhizium album ARSEF 1941]KHO01198.1 hypothetical protein MAM_00199 [Metarhizium album ARSEF 1941]